MDYLEKQELVRSFKTISFMSIIMQTAQLKIYHEFLPFLQLNTKYKNCSLKI